MEIFLTMFASSIFFGAVTGGIITGWVAWKIFQENTARELLSEAMEIQGFLEAYVLDGPNYKKEKFSENLDLTTDPKDSLNGLYLGKVEVRAVLDNDEWNFPESGRLIYKMVDNRRTWIVRDEIKDSPPVSRSTKNPEDGHPAILTSKGFEELWAWIERVASARSSSWTTQVGSQGQESHWWEFRKLSDDGFYILKPLLAALMRVEQREDKIQVIDKLHPLSKKAKDLLRSYQSFLKNYEKKQN